MKARIIRDIRNLFEQKEENKNEIMPKNAGDFCCLNYLHSFKTKNKLESHKKVCENKDCCGTVIPPEDTNQYRKSD